MLSAKAEEWSTTCLEARASADSTVGLPLVITGCEALAQELHPQGCIHRQLGWTDPKTPSHSGPKELPLGFHGRFIRMAVGAKS